MCGNAWYKKYQPKKFEDMVLPDEPFVPKLHEFYKKGFVNGNILTYGKPGMGKSATIRLLIDGIIKHSDNLIELGRATEDIEELKQQLQYQVYADKQKVVLIEEMDKLSSQAQILLKDGLMENYQHKCTFLATTNNIEKIDQALLTRFNFKINFDDLPEVDVFNRLKFILEKENVRFQEDELEKFTKENLHKGMRELINEIELSSVNGIFEINHSSPKERSPKKETLKRSTTPKSKPVYTFIPLPWLPKPQKQVIPTRMLKKKQALEVLNVAATSPIKNEIFEMLPKYENRFNQHAIFREEDVISLLRSFPLKFQGS